MRTSFGEEDTTQHTQLHKSSFPKAHCLWFLHHAEDEMAFLEYVPVIIVKELLPTRKPFPGLDSRGAHQGDTVPLYQLMVMGESHELLLLLLRQIL